MSGYTKLFGSILASTVWSETNETRIVWITLLAMSDRRGVIEGSVPGLAVFARLPVEDTQVALERLCAPDAHSRSKEHEGRRIAVIDGGWQILNHAKYRAKLGADERRDYNRIKQAQHREKKRQEMSLTVIENNQNNHKADPEAEATTEASSNSKVLRTSREQASSNGSAPLLSQRQKDRQTRRAMAETIRRPHDVSRKRRAR